MDHVTQNSEPSLSQANQASGGRAWLWLMGLFVIGAIAAAYTAWQTLAVDSEPQTLTIAAGPYQSDSYDLMREVADVVDRNSKSLRLKILPTLGSSENISLLNRREIHMATIRADTPVDGDVRLVADLFPDYFHLITRMDQPIFKFTDLVGKRIGVPLFGTDELTSFFVLMDHYDVRNEDLRWKAMPFGQAANKILQGELDAIFTVRSLRDRRLLNFFEDAVLKDTAIRYVPLDQAEAIAIKRPFLGVGQVPKGAFVGREPTPEGLVIVPTVSRVLVTRDDLDETPIRELTRILFEHRLDLIIRFALAAAIQQPEEQQGLSVPLHRGSDAYFRRDEPSFIQENAEPLALMVTVFAMLMSGLFALRSRLTSKQKNRMDSYNYVLLEFAERARKTDNHQTVMQIRNEMFALLEKVVRALDEDRVTEEGFQSFSFLFDSVRHEVNTRAQSLE